MKSQWDLIYVGSHTNLFLKKFQRLAELKVTSVETERIIWDGKKLERATFFVQHSQSEWDSLVAEVLTHAQKISGSWLLTLDLPNSLSGRLNLNSNENVEPVIEAPSNMESLNWTLNKNQEYSKIFLTPETNAW